MSNMQISKIAAAYTEAWNSGSPEAVAGFFADDGEIVINHGSPWSGRSGVRDMAAGFFADVPDLRLTCDDVRISDNHVLFLWTFVGHAAETGKPLKIHGWEEWDLNAALEVERSKGWFDAEAYARQSAA